jgi:hypothetical protein
VKATGQFVNLDKTLNMNKDINSRLIVFLSIAILLLASPAFSSNYYWVGGSGTWSNFSAHWATTSGGTIFHSQEPTIADNVYFDGNSFTATGQEVSFLNDTVYCHDIEWAGVFYNPFFNAPSGLLHVGGSMNLTDSIVTQYPFAVSFEATTPGQFVYSNGTFISATFDGAGGNWTMLSVLSCGDLTVRQGDFISNNQLLFIGSLLGGNFVSNSGLPRSVSLGTSEVIVNANWSFSAAGLTLSAASSTISMQNGANVVFDGAGQVYHDVDFINPNAIVNGNNSFDRVVTYDHTTFTGNNTFDTLFIDNPTIPVNPVLFQSGSTQTILMLMEINSAPGHMITIESTTPGVQSTIFLGPNDTICLNYVNLIDQNAIGGGAFFAGSSSNNVSNNSGWQFSDCTQGIPSVWPGDANHDLIVDNFDVLNIATGINLYYGFMRPQATNNFTAQPCMDWPYQDANGTNYKFADSNGDMLILDDDTLAIFQNYGQIHPARLADLHEIISATGPDLYFQIPTTIIPGSTITIPVLLGTSAMPATNVYGIAFSVGYDTSLIVPGSVSINYSGSWLVSAGNNIHIEKSFPLNGQIDLGFARTDQQNVSGNGMIATLTFQIRNNVYGFGLLQLFHVRLISEDGALLSTIPQQSMLYVGMNELEANISASVFPNPTDGLVTISLTNAPAFSTSLQLTDLAGKIILQKEITEQNSQLDISDLDAGTYLVLILVEQQRSVFRIVRD